MNNFIQKVRIERILFIYGLLGHLKAMFWLSVVTTFFAAIWEGVILAAVATMFQTIVDKTKFHSSTFDTNSLMGNFYSYFIQIPEEYRIIAGFSFTAISILIGSIINTGLATFQSWFSTRFIIHVRCEVFNKLYHSSLSYFDNNKKGALISMIITESRSCYAVLKNLLQLTIASLRTIVLFSVLISISLELSGIVLITSIIFLFQTFLVTKIIKRLSVINVERTRSMMVDADESLSAIKLVKLFELYQFVVDSFRKNCTKADFANRQQTLILTWQEVLSNFINICTISILIFTNIIFSFTGISLMLTFLYTIQKLSASLSYLNKTVGTYNNNVTRLDRIVEFFESNYLYIEKSGDQIRKNLLGKKLSFQNVDLSYSYRGTKQKKVKKNEKVLEDINLDVHRGETVALVGRSGAGKTSLANLIVRLYEPTKGKIFIDDVDITNYDLTFLRERIGLVNQNTILFNKSIRENLMYGKKNAKDAEIIDAAKKAHAHEFVTQFADGYDTIIGDRGVKLSGGQRQRLNLAQIFLMSPEIMILDEATSALDSKSEDYIQKSIKKLSEKSTNIIIAHRLSTIMHANKIIVLNKGRIVEEGDWDNLMQAKGLFNDMVKRQFFVGDFENKFSKNFE